MSVARDALLIAATGVVAWCTANPILAVGIFGTGVALATWFVMTYWTWILGAALLFWVVPAVMRILLQFQEVLRGFGFLRHEQEGLLRWVDRKEKAEQGFLMGAYRRFKDTVLRMSSTFTRKNADTFTQTRKTFVDCGNGQGAWITHETEISRDELPDEIRAKITKYRLDEFTVDESEVFDQLIAQRAEEEKMPQLKAMVQ